VEFNYKFEYPLDFLKSYSMPIVECSFDGKWWRYTRSHEGRQRLNPVGGTAPYRIYLYQKVRQLACQFTFPGALNFKPSKITVGNVNWVKFIGDSEPSLRSRPYYFKEPGQTYVETPVTSQGKK
jgi:hypothetical protein